MPHRRTLVRAAHTVVAAVLATGTAVAMASPAQAATFTGPAVRMIPQHVPQSPGQQLVLTADGTSVGNTVRQQVDLGLSVPEQRQFWQDRQRLFNGIIVHRLDNVQNGFSMNVRDGSTSPGALLDQEPLNGQPNQLFRTPWPDLRGT